jgi:hypothetical protein
MLETSIKNAILRRIKETYPKAYVTKISDKFYSGIPDILVIIEGKVFFLEIKTSKGRVAPVQQYHINKINAAQGTARVVRSPAEALAVLKGGNES